MADDNGAIINLLEEGPRCKGGHNPSYRGTARPPAPGGSGGPKAQRIEMLLPYGAKVQIGPESDPIDAVVTQVCVKGAEQVVQYEVVHWASCERKSQWLDASEVRPTEGYRMSIGFIR